MAKKMSKADRAMLIAVVVIALFAVGTFITKHKFKPFAILPELDNRITYYDNPTDVTQYVTNSQGTIGENDKFTIGSSDIRGLVYFQDSISLNCGGSSYANIKTKKDFSRLKSYLSVKFNYRGRVNLGEKDGSNTIQLPISEKDVVTNIEAIPDNLNAGTYNIFKNGEFYQRITNIKSLHYSASISCGGYENGGILIDYIKFVPDDTYTIKNDEVWVKEVRGSDYSYNNLNWEMIGFNSEIRPATIRDLTAQTEKPAPQIYINLINNLPVKVEPNTVHTFFYRTKWVSGLDSSCQGNLDKVEVRQSDGTWKCESYVKETPIIQQCQTKNDCAILPDCESQKELISCNQQTHLCDYSLFSPACKNQLVTYQEKVTEIENTKFVPIISGTNSFYCFFDSTKSSCKIGEKTISVSSPSYACELPTDSSTIVSTGKQPDNCWNTKLSFLNKDYIFTNNAISNNIGSNIKAELSMSASLDSQRKLRDSWSIIGKFTLPDNFLDVKPKSLGNKFVLQNSNEPITFTITNNLEFGIDGGYTIQTQNTALEGGVVLRHETRELFLKNGENDITYNFETKQVGTIVDLIGTFGKLTTDRQYIMKSSTDGKEKYLVITKEIKDVAPAEIEKVQPKVEVIERIIEKERTPLWMWGILIIIIFIAVGLLVWKRYGD